MGTSVSLGPRPVPDQNALARLQHAHARTISLGTGHKFVVNNFFAVELQSSFRSRARLARQSPASALNFYGPPEVNLAPPRR
jgi:hypothetical protein